MRGETIRPLSLQHINELEKIAQRARLLRKENPAKVRAQARESKARHPERAMLMSAKDSAKRKGLAFNIDLSDIYIPDVCPVLGIPLKKVGRGASLSEWYGRPSLDRIDSSKGYVKGNVAVISLKANILKRDGTAEEHARIAVWMSCLVDCSIGESEPFVSEPFPGPGE